MKLMGRLGDGNTGSWCGHISQSMTKLNWSTLHHTWCAGHCYFCTNLDNALPTHDMTVWATGITYVYNCWVPMIAQRATVCFGLVFNNGGQVSMCRQS